MSLKIEVTDDEAILQLICLGLKETGGYCPCHVGKDPDFKCICKEFREQKTEGYCHCGLYKKVKV